MKKPKILHLILDGYSPSNQDNFFDDFKGVIPQEYNHGTFVRVAPDESKLRSPDMWTRCYSKTTFEEIKQEGDSARLGVSTKISRVPAERFLWNKLAKKNVNSWLYPFGHYYKVLQRNVLEEDTKDHVSGFFKMYGTRLGGIIDNGNITWHKSPIGMYYGWHESSWNRESKQTDVFLDYRANWKNPTEEFLARVPDEVHDYYLDRMSYYRDIDEKLFNEEIFPHLQKHIDEGDFENGGYVHIGLVETDTPYHFVPEYPDIVEVLRNYCNAIIDKAVSMLDPDIIIITGDHNMAAVTPEEFSNAKLLDYKNHSGNKRYGAQSSWGITPILTEHGHEVGCMVYAKDSNLIQKFHDEYYERDTYLMYDIYNFIEGQFGDVNEE